MPSVFRFAPSPNGYLHLGHAYSALLNFDSARQGGGRFLLRIEDIDTARCRAEFEAAIFEDLAWLGIAWETPVRRQSEHLGEYREAVEKLAAQGLVYPSFESRAGAREGQSVIPQGTYAAARNGGNPFVVPNPFRARAEWDLNPSAADPSGTHVDFLNLPPQWMIVKIYTLSGDLVKEIRPDDVVPLLVAELEVTPEFRNYLAKKKLKQKYWSEWFAELIIDRFWSELKGG